MEIYTQIVTCELVYRLAGVYLRDIYTSSLQLDGFVTQLLARGSRPPALGINVNSMFFVALIVTAYNWIINYLNV
jgi:hypothetical protein